MKGQTQSNTIRNTRAFVKSYLASESGRKALERAPVRINRQHIWRSSAMAHAFKEALN